MLVTTRVPLAGRLTTVGHGASAACSWPQMGHVQITEIENLLPSVRVWRLGAPQGGGFLLQACRFDEGSRATFDARYAERLMLALFAALTLAAGEAKAGPLTLETIRDVVDAHRAQVRQCYDRSPAAKRQLSGKVVVRFTISDLGTVSDCAVKEATLPDETVKACLVAEVKSWAFPKPKHGPATINFPFRFGPPVRPVPPPPEPVE